MQALVLAIVKGARGKAGRGHDAGAKQGSADGVRVEHGE